MSVALAFAFVGCGDKGDRDANAPSDAAVVTDASDGGSIAEADAAQDICDGSSEIRFALRLVGGEAQPSPRMMTSIGISYLYVRGDCSYWVNPGVYYQWKETRTGTLNQEQQHNLSRAFYYADWRNLTGYHLGNAAGLPSGTLQAFDGENLINCDNSCISYGTSLGEALDHFSEGFKQWSGDLWEAGAPSEPTLRVVAERFESGRPLTGADLDVVIQWPFTWPLTDLLADHQSSGVLLADEGRVRDLRNLRLMYVGKGRVAGEPNPFYEHFSFFVGDDLNVTYGVWFRDVLPFEMSDGTIPFPRSDAEP